MRTRDYFPLGIASGTAFCNREQERTLLLENITNGKHTLLIATRRYGKSSLAINAIKASGLPYVETDFYMASSEKIIESYILNGVVDLIGNALGSIEKMVTSIKRYVKHLKPKLNIGAEHFKLELDSDINTDPATNVKEALLLLEKLLEEKKKHAIFLMDEFQNVGLIAQGKGIEAAIRHVAQKTKYLTFIFSGSNRKLLKTMFEDETRPLYKLCWKLSLKRIPAQHYQKHLEMAAKQAWKKPLASDVVDTILQTTQRHPFYVNKLCDRLWSYYKNSPPTTDEVEQAWLDILNEEKSDAVKEISLLSLGQKSVLLYLAKATNPQLTSKLAMMELKMTSSSVMRALDGLEEKDVIEKLGDQFQIINPVVKYFALKGSK